MNALRRGHRSRAWLELAKRIRRAIRLCARTVLPVPAHTRDVASTDMPAELRGKFQSVIDVCPEKTGGPQ
jgi:hypothetical protein